MKLLREIMNEIELEKKERESRIKQLSLALEHLTYKNIPDTNNSYRQDAANTNTKTEKHVHVYAKHDGKGKELYSVCLSGKGHDGSSGVVISQKHADYFRSCGYQVPQNLTLESIDFSEINEFEYKICILEDDA
jgi:hypothetical protein